ncbi:hypothetical protein KKG36_00820 [Patescibacteria group bacterium]|nr:hypothetical protein [Patescibacteria group bacterium]
MKDTKVSVVARRMMVEERDRIARRKRKQISPIEQSAIAYLKKQEEKERGEKEQQLHLRDQQQSISFQALTEKIVEEKRQNNEAKQDKVAWKQFNPWQDEQEEKKVSKINPASIWLFARKIMAREWARALGKPRNVGLGPLEQSAADWQQEKTKERLKIELAKRKLLLAKEVEVAKRQVEELRAREEEKTRRLIVQMDWTRRRVNA